MTRHRLARRLDALERQQDGASGMYAVDAGGVIVWHGESMPADEWYNRYPGAVCVDIGGDVETYRDIPRHVDALNTVR